MNNPLKIYKYVNGRTKYVLKNSGKALILDRNETLHDCPDILLRKFITKNLDDAEIVTVKNPYPVQADLVHLHLTNRCNLNCSHCYIGHENETLMPFYDACMVVDSLKESGVDSIAFGGGEVSLVPYFHKLIDYTVKCGITPTYTTNGLVLDIDTALKCTGISISVDGIGSMYSFTRGCGEGIWEQIEKNIKVLIKAHSNVMINILVTRKNYNRLIYIVNYFKKLGIRKFLFLRFKPPAGCNHDPALAGTGHTHLLLTEREITTVIQQLIFFSLCSGVQVMMDACSLPYFKIAKTPESVIKQMDLQLDSGCGAGRWFICIDFHCTVKPCSFLDGPFLSLRTHSLTECLTRCNEQSTRTQADLPGICINCTVKKWCHGGCPVLRKQEGADSLCMSERRDMK